MPANSFVWYELITSDAEAAKAFYGKVVGWDMRDAGVPGMSYNILSAGGIEMGGLMGMPPEQCEAWDRPGWLGYIEVEDVDKAAEKVTAAGGAILRAPDDIPNIGRFAVAADNQGAGFILFCPKQGIANTSTAPQRAPGHVSWHSLFAGDEKGAFDFYSGLFGWTETDQMDCGPMGIYRIFATGGEEPAGGMMTKPPAVPAPFWLFYINVDDIDAAKARIEEAGGTVVMGPDPVPGGCFILHGVDPQGADFAVVGPRG
ncbi:glyoxalase [Agaricicola taiwanensis]|uniref:Glyoxalase n=1 Tax=Agaricicola taiwanensis TaxID=591372 RepID=A0A8J2VRN8_9RHOB|nr:VOC family protein [Agaricicola taiwanensis]GGE38858.1 glyoxalase [Agaricicola taiwanensis]